MFYGSGAGKLPTASAVFGDIFECAKYRNVNVGNHWSAQPLNLISNDMVEHKFFVRVAEDKKAAALEVFGAVNEVNADVAGEFAFVTEVLTEAAFAEKAEKLGDIISRIRVR